MKTESIGVVAQLPPEATEAMLAAANVLLRVCAEVATRNLPPDRLVQMDAGDMAGTALASAVAHLLAAEQTRALTLNSRAFSLGAGFGQSIRREAVLDLQALADAIAAGLGGVLSHGHNIQGSLN